MKTTTLVVIMAKRGRPTGGLFSFKLDKPLTGSPRFSSAGLFGSPPASGRSFAAMREERKVKIVPEDLAGLEQETLDELRQACGFVDKEHDVASDDVSPNSLAEHLSQMSRMTLGMKK